MALVLVPLGPVPRSLGQGIGHLDSVSCHPEPAIGRVEAVEDRAAHAGRGHATHEPVALDEHRLGAGARGGHRGRDAAQPAAGHEHVHLRSHGNLACRLEDRLRLILHAFSAPFSRKHLKTQCLADCVLSSPSPRAVCGAHPRPGSGESAAPSPVRARLGWGWAHRLKPLQRIWQSFASCG